jgi:ribosomal protein S27AE
MKRLCPKCGAEAVAERSAVRRTLRCTVCKFIEVKRVIEKGYG